MVWMVGLKNMLGWQRLSLYGRYGYIEMIVFSNKTLSLLQVIYRCTGTFCLWSLQKVEHRDLFTEVYSWLKATTRDTFSLHGWHHNHRIGPPHSPESA
jgi:hypothetical protein